MATKMFCDYCAKEIDSYCGPLIFKCVSPRDAEPDNTVRVFHELCPGCYTQLKEQFGTFIRGLGDNCYD